MIKTICQKLTIPNSECNNFFIIEVILEWTGEVTREIQTLLTVIERNYSPLKYLTAARLFHPTFTQTHKAFASLNSFDITGFSLHYGENSV